MSDDEQREVTVRMAPCTHIVDGKPPGAECILVAQGPFADLPVPGVPGAPKPEPVGMLLCFDCLSQVLAIFKVASGKEARINAAALHIIQGGKGPAS